MCPNSTGTEAPGLGTLPDLTLAGPLDPLLHDKPVKLSKCFPESCELFQHMPEPEKGVVGPCFPAVSRKQGDHLGV